MHPKPETTQLFSKQYKIFFLFFSHMCSLSLSLQRCKQFFFLHLHGSICISLLITKDEYFDVVFLVGSFGQNKFAKKKVAKLLGKGLYAKIAKYDFALSLYRETIFLSPSTCSICISLLITKDELNFDVVFLVGSFGQNIFAKK